MQDNKDFLGTEPIGKLLLKLSIPTVIAQLINMLYNIVDRIYIGHMPGDGSLALTGVGVCMPIIMIVTAFAALVASGGAPRDVRKTAYGLLVRDAHRPRAFRFEIACGPAARLGPRHGSDHDAARRRPSHARGTSFRIGSIGAYPHVDAPGSRARVRNAAANP